MDVTTEYWAVWLALGTYAVAAMRATVNYRGLALAGLVFVMAAIATPFTAYTDAAGSALRAFLAVVGVYLVVESIVNVRQKP